ncbi:MAG: hypothetical protein ACFCUH_13790 [Flavobacteriales bacterium]
MKRFLKRFLAVTAVLLVLPMLVFGVFQLWEYSTGGDYVAYLEANAETVPLESTFNYQRIAGDLDQAKLILVGEIHGFDEPSAFDASFFKYLHAEHGVRHYFAEFDCLQAFLLNGYLETGDLETLNRVLNSWSVFQGRDNADYQAKFIALQQYYIGLPDSARFSFVGIDRIQDNNLVFDVLAAMTPQPGSYDKERNTLSDLVEAMLDNGATGDTLALALELSRNIDYIVEKVDREEIFFQNFVHHYTALNTETAKFYGFFGLSHVLQYQVNQQDQLAGKIRKSDLGLEGKIVSINFMMNDSYMVMPSNQLPSFLSDEGKYTRMPISADNPLLLYIVGIKDFKRMTPEFHKSLIKLNSEDSPYDGSSRMSTTIQLLPFGEKMNFNEKGKAYTQYTVFVRNSDWAEPVSSK